MPRNKIYGGTPNFSTPSQCVTCRAGHIMRDSAGVERTLCRAGGYSEPFVVVHAVTFCNMYEDKRMPTQWEMEKIAWRVSVDNHRQQIGFGGGRAVEILSPQQFKEKHPDED